jgi:hypothetical protein
MHTFKAPSGTVFHYNSDFSGEIRVEQFYGTVEDAVEVPVADLLKFADHVRGNPPDRERIEFIRRAAIAVWADPVQMDEAKCWEWAAKLWNAKPEGM